MPAEKDLFDNYLTEQTLPLLYVGRVHLSSVYFVSFTLLLTENPVNNVDPDQTPHDVASDLGLHCLPMTPLRVSSKKGLTYHLR